MTITEYSDTALAAQPIGYWSGVAHKAVITHLRATLAKEQLGQPHWWTLNHVDGSPGAWTPEDLARRLQPFADPGVAFEPVFAELVARGWLVERGGVLDLTSAGETGLARTRERMARATARIHDGVDDADFVVTMRVLRRMIHNVGGDSDLP
ncbi:MarR family winged helix-turn-helix transcriptional regulator [Yinghuangia seranimata]|uniref:MarR family winged helix-turn-helix transcriptional regulator n=1 Tax=Yinghuangia seranimata TaxID=408067 RepID=UPI00248BDE82|nr:MarR family transcriptional regulator [Yinghuangia seranimata]MDI2132795.1 MarR family transcriptional regulator [Yinghuangia seranimata]